MSSSKGKGNPFAHPPGAKPQDPSGNTPHKHSATGSNSSGRATYYGTVVDANYYSARCDLVDEKVEIAIDDPICPHRRVESRGLAARNLREAVGGMWWERMPVTVTLRGVTDIIERVESRIEVVGEADERLTPAVLE